MRDLCVALVVWSTILIGSANAQIRRSQTAEPQVVPTPFDVLTQQQIYSLRHLSKILVEVNTHRADADLQGWLTQNKPEAKIASTFRNAGLTVVGSKEWGQALMRIPIFQVSIYSYRLSNGAHIYAMNAFLQEGVLPLRGRDRHEDSVPLAATWTATNLRYLPTPKDWSKVMEDLDGAVGLFLADLEESRRRYGKSK